MSFRGSILLLVSICLFVAMPYGIGHGLAAHNTTATVIGLILGAASILLFFVQRRAGGAHSE